MSILTVYFKNVQSIQDCVTQPAYDFIGGNSINGKENAPGLFFVNTKVTDLESKGENLQSHEVAGRQELI